MKTTIIVLLLVLGAGAANADPGGRLERRRARLEQRALRKAYRYDERTDRRRDGVATVVLAALLLTTYIVLDKNRQP